MAFDGGFKTLANGSNPSVLDEVLDGDYTFAKLAFSWGDSPQGHDYWREKFDNGLPLSNADRLFLIDLRYFSEMIREKISRDKEEAAINLEIERGLKEVADSKRELHELEAQIREFKRWR